MTLNRKIPSETKMYTNIFLTSNAIIIKNQPDFSETNFWKVKKKKNSYVQMVEVMVESGLS